ncbi:unnamed protein product, partial [Dovyalis caffra]
VADWFAKLWPFRTIGPTIPSMYLDKQLEDDKDYGISLFKPNNDFYMNWLNDRPKGSVVYVSFGSLVDLKAEQMEELAWGLKRSNCYFLWVVRASEEAKLSKDFAEESSKGLVVRWCSQLEVLAHEAVGCFVTHCGWNSSLEALSLGVPMVAMPNRTDQSTNAKYITDVWKMGIKAPVDEKGIARREIIESCLTEILEGEKGKEIKSNACRWKELAKEAVNQGGSSDTNIDEFVATLQRATVSDSCTMETGSIDKAAAESIEQISDEQSIESVLVFLIKDLSRKMVCKQLSHEQSIESVSVFLIEDSSRKRTCKCQES